MGHSLDSTEKSTSASALDPMTTSNASVPLGRRQSMACMQVRDAAAAELLVISVASRRRTGTDFRSSHLSSIPSLDLLSTSKHAPLGPTCSSHEQDKPRHCHVAASSMHKTLFNRGHRDLTDLVLGVVRVAQTSPSGQSSTRVEAMVCTLYLVPDLGLGLAFPTGPSLVDIGKGFRSAETVARSGIILRLARRASRVPGRFPYAPTSPNRMTLCEQDTHTTNTPPRSSCYPNVRKNVQTTISRQRWLGGSGRMRFKLGPAGM